MTTLTSRPIDSKPKMWIHADIAQFEWQRGETRISKLDDSGQYELAVTIGGDRESMSAVITAIKCAYTAAGIEFAYTDRIV